MRKIDNYINKIILGDCLQVMKEIPSSSIDLIITDPPYEEKYNYLWEPFAEQSSRLLKVGGSLVTLCGHYQLPYVISSLNKYLRYWWIGWLYHPGNFNRFPGKWVCITGKPFLWYVKEKRKKKDYRCPEDTIFSDLQQSKIAKLKHKWGQSENLFSKYIKELSNENDVILDPFIGSGTTIRVAKKLNRKFIGIEIDKKYYELCKEIE